MIPVDLQCIPCVRKIVPVNKTAFAVLVLIILAAGNPAAAALPAPTPQGPSNGASVTVPFAISWSSVTDPGGATIIGYNWRLSPSSSMTPIVRMNSTSGIVTQDTVSGLVAGTYFWQVQAVNSAGQQGPFSQAQSVTVTGAGPGTPGTPVLNPTRGYSTFHPWEFIFFSWSNVPSAVTYRLEVSNDPNFPLGPTPSGVVTFWFDNIRTTSDGFVSHASLGEGTFYARVFATDSDFAGGVRSLASNVIQYTVFYNNPIGPPPTLLSPVNGETLTLPVTLNWAHVPNPQAAGYLLQVATDSTFTNIEFSYNQYTDPTATMLSLTPGPKFWRVLSQHGFSSPATFNSPGTNANTAWSAVGTFVISSAPATPVSIGPLGNPGLVMYSGASGMVAVQLTAAVPAGGATVALSSSNPTLAPIPSSITMPGNSAWAQFPLAVGQVTAPTPVTLTATLNGVSASTQFTLLPPTLNDDPLQPTLRATGGAAISGFLDLEGSGLSGPAGFAVNLSSNSSAASVPATVTIPAGVSGTSFQIQTSPVTATTVATITASAGGVTTQWQITLTPSPAPTSFFVRPMSTTNGSQGVVNTAEGAGSDQIMQVTSSNPALATVPSVVTVSAGSGIGFFNIVTAAVTAPTLVNISVSGGGVTLSFPLTLYPSLPALTAFTVNPTSVVGGASSTGTVTLNSPAPAGGLAINLGASLPLAANVPPSVTVPAGATSASFTVTTYPHDTTTVQFTAALDNVFQTAAISVNPPAPAGPVLSAIALNPTSVVGGASSTGTVTLSAAAPAGGIAVSLSDDSSAAKVPASVTVPAGATSATFTVTTTSVTTPTTVNISGSSGGTTRLTPLTVNPPPAPAPASLSSIAVSPASVVGPAASTGTAKLTAAAPAGGAVVTLSSSNTAAASVPATVTVPAGATSATFNIATTAVSANASVTLTGTYNSISRTAALTVTAPPPPASLSTLTLNPTSVTGGSSSTGTVALTSAAPSGGAVVSLSSNSTGASVPASVTVGAGATTATFPITTSRVTASASATISAVYGGITRTATLTLNPPSANVSLTVTATGRNGEQVTSSPAGINVAVGSTASASFAVNTSITLSVSNGRDAIWSGACSSGGNKAKTCTFSISGNAVVTGNVR